MGDKVLVGKHHEKRGEDVLTVFKSDDGDVIQIDQFDARAAYNKYQGINLWAESAPALIKLIQKAAGIKDEKVEYEYAMLSSYRDEPGANPIREEAWTTKNKALKDLTAYTTGEGGAFYRDKFIFSLVKRRKAGKVESAA